MNQFERNYKYGIFDQYGAIQDDATAADVLNQAFQAPNTNSSDILVKMVMVTVDEIDLVNRALETSDPDCEAIQRVLVRMRDRLLIGIDLRKRCAAAERVENEAKATAAEVSP